MEYFNKEELRNEIRGYMWALADCLERVYFPKCGWALLGLDPKNFKEESISLLKPEAIDIDKFIVTDVLMELYDYGINGERRGDWNWIDMATDTLSFIDGLKNFLLLHESSIRFSLDLSQHVLAVAHARNLLDEQEGITSVTDEAAVGLGVRGGVLMLSDVALLANMDEKSVRNAANPKHKNHLKTFNHGSRTYVTAEDALAWLKERRGFKPTVYIPQDAERNLTTSGFLSLADFGAYLLAQRKESGLTPQQVVKAVANPAMTLEALATMEKGEQIHFDRTAFIALAKALQLNVKTFVQASLTLHHRIEKALVEASLANLEEE
ncbi:hypothetical protein EDC30_11928 [Paucimonas lemoignei]|uniref:Uncharacterized protein n=1 Tax=Paucimonas lemoignei TaxID=29443 RepID=A0A4R3HU20_PAULE|nr:helix-turn-helix transcriptional regulator [Paucimonas lemoignei]TCS32917.1 hypothetical protein EDC30_11928 [Paucimonas lemoignei]